MPKTAAYASQTATAPLAPFSIDRREPGPRDVQIEILFCGVCHSDLHQARNEWGNTTFPCVPGHEIVGRVKGVGAEVRKFKAGDVVGVGCLVDSCRKCRGCKDGLEQFCEGTGAGPGMIFTYNSPDPRPGGGPITYGGYSSGITVDQDFVLSIPKGMDPAAAAPLLCAGITTYSPLHHWKVGKGQKVGIVGLGGLGHMGVKLAHAVGAHVVLFTTSPGKAEDGKRLGAAEVIISKNKSEMDAHTGSFDFILNTVSASHDINALMGQLRRDGTMVLVGAPPPEHPHPPLEVFGMIFGRKRIAGSLIGGIKETQEMLDFCGGKGIASDIEIIPIQRINESYERMLKGDVKYRFVIDMSSLKA